MICQMVVHLSCYGSLDDTRDFFIDPNYTHGSSWIVMTFQIVKCVGLGV